MADVSVEPSRVKDGERHGEAVVSMQDGDIPVLDVVAGPGRVTRATLHELWVFREVLEAFAVRQVKVKYKQAAVGVGWVVIQPVLSAALFAVFLGHVAKLGSEGQPYLLFALAGMVVWSYFSTATGQAMESCVTDASLLRKIYFPREVLPLAAVGAALVDLVPGLLTLFIASFIYGIPPHYTWVALFLPFGVVVVLAAALGFLFAGINVYYRDVRYALPFLLQVGLFASPVIYSLSLVPSSWRGAYAILNPVAGSIDGVRRIVLHHTWPVWSYTFGGLAWSLLLLVGGYALFKRLERGFSDRV
jgi:lipopolysaccharide transport system permease protein